MRHPLMEVGNALTAAVDFAADFPTHIAFSVNIHPCIARIVVPKIVASGSLPEHFQKSQYLDEVLDRFKPTVRAGPKPQPLSLGDSAAPPGRCREACAHPRCTVRP